VTRAGLRVWFDATFLELARQMRLSFLPPLMVYFAAGVQGLTGIVTAFFVKDYLDLSAAFIAGLTFWTGIPWVLKMPLGHLVDLLWRWKAWMVVAGAGLIAASLWIMYALISHRDAMAAVLEPATWFVIATLMAPTGYVVQDVVADAMTVEAVPATDARGAPLPDERTKALHTTMQTLGRFSIITGLVSVALLNLFMFTGVEEMSFERKIETYADIYALAFAIPLLSVTGVALAGLLKRRRAAEMRGHGVSEEEIDRLIHAPAERAEADWQIFAGGALFVAVTFAVGLSDFRWSAEAIFAGSMGIVIFLIRRLMHELDRERARALVGTAIIIFVFRAVPLPGPGLTWFEIDVLGFDERFLSVLSLITSGLTLVGLLVLRPLMARWSIARIVALLAVAAGLLSLPNIGLYYGLHEWTAPLTGGIVDARFIAILDTAIESPLGQVSMIPMLAWIARNAPRHLKATFFAVMASFTNLALSASSLLTKHLNNIFVVTRERRDPDTGEVIAGADYSELGTILLIVGATSVLAPLIAILVVQSSRFRTED
jgi:hypothetical protein